jgi:hypothetical protein
MKKVCISILGCPGISQDEKCHPGISLRGISLDILRYPRIPILIQVVRIPDV